MKYTFAQLKDTYPPLWDGLVVVKENDAKAEASKILKYKSVYQGLEAKSGVPWFAIGIIHTREAGSVDVGRWQCVLHNGERIVGTGRKTRLVPAGKGPFATFEAAALDALAGYKGQTWSVSFLAYTLEKFNGFGYRSHGIPSPYLWGGTNHQKRGKYVSDGNYDPDMMDPQVGGMALLEELLLLDPSIHFGEAPTKPASTPQSTRHEDAPAPTSTPTGPDETSSKAQLPKPDAHTVSWFGGLFASAMAWFQHHRIAVAVTAVLLVVAFLSYQKFVKPRLWSNPSPKAQEGDPPADSNTDPAVNSVAPVEQTNPTTG